MDCSFMGQIFLFDRAAGKLSSESVGRVKNIPGWRQIRQGVPERKQNFRFSPPSAKNTGE
jgi:hypothetical protein